MRSAGHTHLEGAPEAVAHGVVEDRVDAARYVEKDPRDGCEQLVHLHLWEEGEGLLMGVISSGCVTKRVTLRLYQYSRVFVLLMK